MNALPVEFKENVSRARNLAFLFLVALALIACSSSTSTTPTAETAPGPALPPQAASQLPIILRVIDREETVDGF